MTMEESTPEHVLRTESIKIGCTIFMELTPFAHALYARPDGDFVDYFESAATSSKGMLVKPYFEATAHLLLPNEREIVDIRTVPRVHYMLVSGPKEYLTVKANKSVFYTNDTPAIEDLFTAKVVDRTTSRLEEIDNRILKAIKENEEFRKSRP